MDTAFYKKDTVWWRDGNGLFCIKIYYSIDTARLRRVFIDHRFTQMDTDLEPVARIVND